MSVRAWNIVLLAALSTEGSRCSSLLLQNFNSFTSSFFTSLTPGGPITPDYLALEDIEISRAYIAVKLWLLLARKASQGGGGDFDTTGGMDSEEVGDEEAATTRMIWNQLWPLFLTALHALEQDGQAMSTSVGHSRSLVKWVFS